MIPAWVGPAISIGSGLFSAFGGDDDPLDQNEYYKDYYEGGSQAMDWGGGLYKKGRQRLDPMWTPYGPTPYLSDAGRPEAANLGMGAYMQGAGAFDTMTDPRMMLDVANNPYVMNMANAAANEAQRRTAAKYAGRSYGSSSQLKETTGAITDAMSNILGNAYGQGLTAMQGALTMTPEMTQLPLEQMDAYQMGDWDWLDRYTDTVSAFAPGGPPAEQASTLEKFGSGMEAGAGLFGDLFGEGGVLTGIFG